MFKDRYDAAKQLATELIKYKVDPNTVIIAIPRGALEIGSVLAHKLDLPLDVILTKKIGAPSNPEAAIGSVTLSDYVINPRFSVDPDYIEKEIIKIRKILTERYQDYYRNIDPIDLRAKTVIIVDDGVATGQTILSAIKLIKQQDPLKIIVALPVCSREAYQVIKNEVNEIISLLVPHGLQAVGQFYQNFTQVDDREAIRLLEESRA
ncbi:MAG: hypothetical protein KAX05_16100 [Bacteroidales bacterium]|nr:hypothetical protein [Bacteroidales bacterium]